MPLAVLCPKRPSRPVEGTIEIGLLNNLSDAGFECGERQIIELLADAVDKRSVRLSLFSLSSIERGPLARERMRRRYFPVERLKCRKLDGLIVTGCEPRAETLPEEAFWSELTEIIDWAEQMTRSTIWSCLSAHAAILHLDGLARRRLPEKRSGIYAVKSVSPHPLIHGAPCEILVPHSRWNDVSAGDLIESGYQILTRGDVVGVDSFIKEWRSLFVYLQGHPEYDARALEREFRRDVARYFDGVSPYCPKPPENYFEPTMEKMVAGALKMSIGHSYDFPRDPFLRSDVAGNTRQWSRLLFANWLSLIAPAEDRLPKREVDQPLRSPTKESHP